MPPKKRSKVTAAGRAAISVIETAAGAAPAGADGAAAAAAAAAAPLASPLTVGGIDALRALSKHRPQRVALGGMALGGAAMAASAPAALAPPPPPVTLQIVEVQRCQPQHTHRFKSGCTRNNSDNNSAGA